MQVLIDATTRQILSYGRYTGPPPAGQAFATIPDTEVAKFGQRGTKTLAVDGTVSVVLNPAIVAAEQAEAQERAAARATARQLAQTAVGGSIASASPAQVRALLAVLLGQVGALNGDGSVRPLSEWAGQ